MGQARVARRRDRARSWPRLRVSNVRERLRRGAHRLVGPLAVWRNSSTPTLAIENGTADDASFSTTGATLQEGASATITLAIAPAEAVRFEASPQSAPLGDVRAFTLDVVWPRHGEPEATLYEGTLADAPEAVGAGTEPFDRACNQPTEADEH